MLIILICYSATLCAVYFNLCYVLTFYAAELSGMLNYRKKCDIWLSYLFQYVICIYTQLGYGG